MVLRKRATKVLKSLLVVLLILSLSGCALLDLDGSKARREEANKMSSERIGEINNEFERLFEQKYGEDFEQHGIAQMDVNEIIFWFKSVDTGLLFQSTYFGDYYKEPFTDEMTGRFRDNYWLGKISYETTQSYMPQIDSIFSGIFGEIEIYPYFNNTTEKKVKQFQAWVEDWDTDLSDYYDPDYLMTELEKAPDISLLAVYFKTVTKENVDELYGEVYNMVMELKATGVKKMNIQFEIYDEKYLTDGTVDLENFDKDKIYQESGKQRIALNTRNLILDEVKSLNDLKNVLYVVERNGENTDVWLGGQNGN
ncbi:MULTISPECIES: hypothetical protein [unclassified Fusibacter]|uniref:hypothetical protein n=1 Tax=unclassified Fusibacter TaxID=2624464 RepID=UPI001012B16C|nr:MULTISPECIES: hypothetical protein [unclassified Fusibacter]MCK8059039.1 hypothetical protein [Fusibacter sp. A2]NPE22450.1 hypothetical protein [Fusibacter sp. A1]RXV60554.1 hypothetical protein DWB64_11430 [Fusibacter sp. A1]